MAAITPFLPGDMGDISRYVPLWCDVSGRYCYVTNNKMLCCPTTEFWNWILKSSWNLQPSTARTGSDWYIEYFPEALGLIEEHTDSEVQQSKNIVDKIKQIRENGKYR
jgi:hypothetical protein